MNRRKFLTASFAISLAALAPGLVAASDIAVVELANFSCPNCMAMERYADGFAKQLAEVGGSLVFAPLATADHHSIYRDAVYFAARTQGDSLALAVRRSLFRGAQTHSLPMEDAEQVLEWLQQDLGGGVSINWPQLRTDIYTRETQAALGKAYRLAQQAHLDTVPTYVVIQNGAITSTLSQESGELPPQFAQRIRGALSALTRKEK